LRSRQATFKVEGRPIINGKGGQRVKQKKWREGRDRSKERDNRGDIWNHEKEDNTTGKAVPRTL